MKLINCIYILSLTAITTLTSCSNDIENVFTDSSANRIDAALAQFQDILIGPANGWIMEYFPGPAQSYGGFNVLMQFTFDGHVTVAAESAKPEETARSTYSLKQSAGAVLSFDTYNRIFHFYSDPANPKGYGSNGYGMEGDFEFLIISAASDEIILKGKKSGSYAVMRPMSMYYTWADYLVAVKKAADRIGEYRRMQYRSGDDVYEVRHEGKAFQVYKSGKDGDYIESHPYIVNLMGCRFYTPITFAENDVVEGVVINPSIGDEGALVPTNDASGMFIPSYPPVNEYLITKNWFMTYSQLSAWAQAKWDETRKEFNRCGINMTYCYIGEESNIMGDYYAFNFKTTDGSGSIELEYELIGTDRISLRIGTLSTTLAKQLYSECGMQSMLAPLGDPDKRTFTLTADNPKNPMRIKCVDESDEANYFIVAREKIYSPLDN